ncbi:MAG: N-acetyl-gamma-glutamyl-phosphate reductase [Lachnospiraceae bacterium]|nr:N-acetyl-gamma-glutamyl-phosphate reductase [Lachnospiraceae bacterium]
MKKIFIDGSEGTTGLRINERFQGRDDIEILSIDPEKRKDPQERKKMIAASDITFLCLPDAAAIEAAELAEGEDVILIDSSTAHRTQEGWAYGFPELSERHREAIVHGKRIAVPGCHATGLISLAYPLVAAGVMPADYPVVSYSLTGYSGGGKKMIAQYEARERDEELDSPREYGLTQKHKHLKEMQHVVGLARAPLFSPIVADYYSGMLVTLPLYLELLNGSQSVESVHALYEKHYADQPFIRVMPLGAESETGGFLAGNSVSGWDGLRIYVSGNEERIQVASQFDNLGKGASGAAVECLNLVLGCDPAKGLNL